MNPETLTPPLTLDETIRLAAFLAERGQPEALFSVIGRIALDVAAGTMSEGASN